MKPTLVKDSLRTIKRQIVSYISVVVISALASSIYLSVSFASKTILNNGDTYYQQSNYRDAELFYNTGARQEDIEYFAGLDGVSEVEGEYTLTCMLSTEDEPIDIDVMSMTQSINTPILLDGQLPVCHNECLIEEATAEEHSIHIGDHISFTDKDGSVPELAYDEYIVTGIYYHPNNLCIQLYTNNNPVVLIPLEGFDQEARHSLFTSILLTFDNTEGLSRFDPAYLEAVHDMEAALAPAIEQRGGIIYTGVTGEFESTIAQYQSDLDAAWDQLTDAREQIDQGWRDLADGQRELNESQDQLTSSREELDDAQAQLNSARIQLDNAQQQLDAAWQQLQDNLALLNEGEAQLAPRYAELQAGRARLDEAELQLAQAQAQLQSASEQINQGRIAADAAGQQLAASEAQLNQAQAEIDSHAGEVADLQAQLETATDSINTNVVPFATNLHIILKALIGDYADIFDWSQLETPIDYHDRDAHINSYILPGGIVIDIGQPLSFNVESLLNSLGLSEELLAAAYSAATGEPAILPEGMSSWHQYISVLAADRLITVFPQYNDLTDAVNQWETGHDYYIQYNDAVIEVQNGWNQYYEGLNQYNIGVAVLNNSIAYYDDQVAAYDQGLAEYNQGLAAYEQGLAEYNAARATLDNGWAQYYAALEQYNAGLAEFERNNQAYEEGLAAFEAGTEEYNDGLVRYEQGLIDYDNSHEELLSAEETYAENLAAYENGVEELDSIRDSIYGDGVSRFLFTDITVNRSFCIIRRTGGNLADIGRTFTLVFVIIAALVIYATLGRIVDEQRTLVGTNKALGFFNSEVLSKYLLFGLTGTLIGTLIGTVAGYYVIVPIIMKGYSHNYVYGSGKLFFDPLLSAVVVVIAIVLSAGTIVFACLSMLTSNAITLLAPRVPSTRKKRGNSKSAKLLYPKLLVMNMLSDKKRVIATIVSVLGCSTLLAAGFGMQFAIKGSIAGQFIKYEHYDFRVTFDNSINPSAGEEVIDALEENGTRYVGMSDHYMATRVADTLVVIELMCGDLDEIDEYFSLNDASTEEHLDASLPGIWIHKKLSEYYDVHPGDSITIYDDHLTSYEVPIAGIYENNLGFYSFMNRDEYVAVFGTEPEDNTYFIFQNEAGPRNLITDIGQIDGIKEFKNNVELRDHYLKVASALDGLSILFIAMSAMLAYFILLNLVSMLINQKKKELTIMRVNGFSLMKTINYVAGELGICAVIGTILGLVCGTALELSIIKLLESDQIRFDRDIQWAGCIYAALITIFFTALVSAPILRKIKFLKLTDMMV